MGVWVIKRDVLQVRSCREASPQSQALLTCPSSGAACFLPLSWVSPAGLSPAAQQAPGFQSPFCPTTPPPTPSKGLLTCFVLAVSCLRVGPLHCGQPCCLLNE